MPGFRRVIACAAVGAVICVTAARLTGQAPAPVGHGRSVAVAASGAALPDALASVTAMLSAGTLDIAAIQEDTMIAGRAAERLNQFHRGLPVFGGQVVRQIDGRSVLSISGRLYEDVDVDVNPSISRDRAGEIAAATLGAGAQVTGESVLGVLPVDGGYRLAYQTRVRSEWAIRDVFVDAVTGDVLRSLNRLHSQVVGQGTGVFGTIRKMSTTEDSSAFRAIDLLRPAEGFTLDFRGSLARLNLFLLIGSVFSSDVAFDADNVWTDGAVVDAHVFHGWTYDYYFKRFGRRGMDDRNLQVQSVVHPLARSEASRAPDEIVNSFINNALYLGSGQLLYGEGDGIVFDNLAAGIDVVAHEWTHGVTDYTSQLIYQDESGALNEAFSDIMATAIEFYFQPVGTGRDQADWRIGEDVTLIAPGHIRSLENPRSAGEPDHYSLRQFIGTDIDDGGIHFNATIATHAYYLAVAGGRNRVSDIAVTGVGVANRERMERIFYRAFTMLMAPNATFSDARRATIQAATDLFGAGSNDRTQVEQAWTAVGVN